MANVVVIIIMIFIALLFIVWAVGKVSGAVQAHDRCKFCRKKLKFNAGKYATTCSKCGRSQPWAT